MISRPAVYTAPKGVWGMVLLILGIPAALLLYLLILGSREDRQQADREQLEYLRRRRKGKKK